MPQGVQLFRGAVSAAADGSTATTLFTAPSAGGIIACRAILNRLMFQRSTGWSNTAYMTITLNSTNGSQSVLCHQQIQANFYCYSHPIIDHNDPMPGTSSGYSSPSPSHAYLVGSGGSNTNFTDIGYTSFLGNTNGINMRAFYLGPGDSVLFRCNAPSTSTNLNVAYSFTVITEY